MSDARVPTEDGLRQAAWILARCLELGDSVEGVVWLASQMQSIAAGQVIAGEPLAIWQCAAHGIDTELGNGYVCFRVPDAEKHLGRK